MDTQTFLNNFGTIAEAPGGIDRFRALVVSLAVRGGLGTRDKADPPARDLVIQQGVSNVGGRFEIPSSWAWVRLTDVLDHRLGKMLNKKTMTGTPRRYLRSVNVRKAGGIDVTDLNEMLLETEEWERYSVLPGDLFVIEGGDVGRSAVWRGEGGNQLAFQNQLHRLRARDGMPPDYFQLAISEAKTSGFIESEASGVTIQHYSAAKLRSLPISLPPLAEQHRIVAKVDELMTLCDELETQQQTRQQTTTRFRSSALDSLVNAESDDELRTAWQRVQENWSVLTNEAEGIVQLRETALALAFSGRLSRQDPTEESAAAVLQRCADEEDSQSRRKKRSDQVTALDHPVWSPDLPGGWALCKIGDVTSIRTGKLDANASSPDGEYPFFTCAKDPLRISSFSYDAEAVLLAGNGNFDVNYYSGKFDAYQRTYIIRSLLDDEVLVPFLYRFFQFYSKSLREQSIGGVISYIKIGFLTEAPFMLPPVAEQARIITMVDRIMSLCDRLEASLRRRDGEATLFAGSAAYTLAS